VKNIVLLLVFFIVFVLSLVQEPISDTIDALAGATNDTYSTTVDGLGGVSRDDDDDEDDD
jgi:hypothetical protein